jgi:NAD(P)H-dependent FMN reductase
MPFMPQLLIVIGSTRPGRHGLPIARWFASRAEAHGGFDVQVADLAEVGLPFLDEPHHPRLRRYEHEHTKAWSAVVDPADAVVFVTPEYNHGMPAPLKNAIDFLHHEWRYKPAGFVSYGGVAAGSRAVQQLKQSLLALKMTPLYESVMIPSQVEHFDEDGRFTANDRLERAAVAMLDELMRVERALRELRTVVAT